MERRRRCLIDDKTIRYKPLETLFLWKTVELYIFIQFKRRYFLYFDWQNISIRNFTILSKYLPTIINISKRYINCARGILACFYNLFVTTVYTYIPIICIITYCSCIKLCVKYIPTFLSWKDDVDVWSMTKRIGINH